ncbi:MAG TPA: hypothetical protein VF472_04590 [Burkholderiaceae bacterium]
MNALLWTLQGLLALHTLMGAGWKLFNSEQGVPALSAMPHALWVGLRPLELVCSVCLVLPLFNKSFAMLAPAAALCIAAEMLLFAGVYLASGSTQSGQLVYWAAMAAICAFIAYGRMGLVPLQAT